MSSTDAGRCLRAAGAWAVFLATVHVALVALSVAGAFVGAAVAWAIVFAAAVAACLVWRAFPAPPAAPAQSSEVPRLPGARLILVAAGLVFLVLTVVAWVGHDRSFDGNAYHLPMLHLWAMKGRICWVEPQFHWEMYMNGFPKGVESVAFVTARAFGSGAVNAVNLVFLPLGVMGACALARLLGAGCVASAFAGAAFVLVPINICQSTTTYVDTAFAACVVAMLAMLAWTLVEAGREGGRVPWRALPCLAAAASLLVAAKASGLMILGVAVGAFIAGALVRRRNAGRAVGFALAAAVLALALGGYWYARNWAHTGNPLYPAGLSVGGKVIFRGFDLGGMLQEKRMSPGGLDAVAPALRPLVTWTGMGLGAERWPRTIFSCDSKLGGLGFVWVIGGIPAVAVLLVRSLRRRDDRAAAFLFLLAACAVAFAAMPLNWHPRYVIWLHGLALASLAAVAAPEGLSGAGRGVRSWFIACVLVVLVEAAVALGVTSILTLSPNVDARTLYVSGGLSQLWKRGDWLAAGFPGMPASGSLLEVIEGGEPVAVDWTLDPVLLGPMSRPFGRRVIVPLRDEFDARALERVRQAGVRIVLFGDRGVPGELLLSVAESVKREPGCTIVRLKR